jgi:hypothetical protein
VYWATVPSPPSRRIRASGYCPPTGAVVQAASVTDTGRKLSRFIRIPFTVARYDAPNSSRTEAPMPEPERPGHRRHTYLLSLWQEGGTWRAALRPADGGPRQGFGDLEQLAAFLLRLQDEYSVAHPAGPTPEGGRAAHRDT